MQPRVLELTEREELVLDKDEFSEEWAITLNSDYGNQIDIKPPSFLTGHQWKLQPRGWVGYIPLNESVHFSLAPKVPISNLFRMLEYAYRLPFRLLEGMTGADSLSDVYERLASVLAKRIRVRLRQGLYRSYIQERERLPFVRGRIDIPSQLRNPHRIKIPCDFDDHTSDLEDNQILLWTLTRILESGRCSERTLPYIRQARRGLLGFASLKPFSPKKCIARLYNRLNNDYEPLHALCRFFLEHTGPKHLAGDNRMLPILVNMDNLFERFVLEWLRIHMPKRYLVHGQENVEFQMGNVVTIKIDISIEDLESGQTAFILDTKYKTPDRPDAHDLEQIIAYAEAKACRRAALIYPIELPSPIRGKWGKSIEARSLSFILSGDIEESGEELLAQLFE